MHKIVRASKEEGLAEARLLLLDWLVILMAHYNEHYGTTAFGEAAASASLDVTFAKCEALQTVPRLVFAMLQSPLLRPVKAAGALSVARAFSAEAMRPAILFRAGRRSARTDVLVLTVGSTTCLQHGTYFQFAYGCRYTLACERGNSCSSVDASGTLSKRTVRSVAMNSRNAPRNDGCTLILLLYEIPLRASCGGEMVMTRIGNARCVLTWRDLEPADA